MPTVLVTSASRGIGREFVRQFAAEGWRVIAACRHPEEVDAELRAFGDGVRPIALDVTDLASVEAVAREEDEPLDLLLNTAGVIGQGPTRPGEVNYAEWTRVLDINTMGPVRVLDALTDRLAAAGSAKAITLTSGLGSIADVGVRRPVDVSHLEGRGEHGDARAVVHAAPARHHRRGDQSRLGPHRHGRPRRLDLGGAEHRRDAQGDRRAHPRADRDVPQLERRRLRLVAANLDGSTREFQFGSPFADITVTGRVVAPQLS